MSKSALEQRRRQLFLVLHPDKAGPDRTVREAYDIVNAAFEDAIMTLADPWAS